MPLVHRLIRSVAMVALLLYAAGCDRSAVVPTSFDVVSADTAQGRIAFVSSRDGNAEIYVMNADGTGVTRVTDNPATDTDPAWSPDGSRIAFASTRDGNYELYVMNADGSGVTRLTTDPGRDRRPAWCGTRIAFQTDRLLPPFYDIYVMNDDGTGATRLTISNASSDEYPTWSPTCDQIAYSYDPGGSAAAISVMNSDGSGNHGLVWAPSKDQNPAWSPDGTRIAFASDRDTPGSSFEIYVMNADGTQQARLTVTPAFHIYDYPAWSFDGTQIAFQAIANGAPGMYVMNADGSSMTLLADSVSNERPSWTGPAAPPPPPPPPPVPPPPPPPVPPPPPPPVPPPPPPPDEIHIGDLDGSASRNGPTWTASIEITLHSVSHDSTAAGAIVTGVRSAGGSSSCTSGGGTSTCVVSLAGLRRHVGSVTFTVTDVAQTGAVYTATPNHDVDGNSDGTSISVSKP